MVCLFVLMYFLYLHIIKCRVSFFRKFIISASSPCRFHVLWTLFVSPFVICFQLRIMVIGASKTRLKQNEQFGNCKNTRKKENFCSIVRLNFVFHFPQKKTIPCPTNAAISMIPSTCTKMRVSKKMFFTAAYQRAAASFLNISLTKKIPSENSVNFQ